MFICKDCKSEYSVKPEYCSCGNNVFEEIPTKNYENAENTNINSNAIMLKSKTLLESLDIASVSFFVFCIILSLIAWCCLNPNNNITNKPKYETKLEKNNNIPNEDTLWEDKLPVAKIKGQSKITKNDIKNKTFKSKKDDVTKALVEKKISTKNNVKKADNTSVQNSISKYKFGLKQTLFSNVNFASVNGVGRCEIEFKVDKNGLLTNQHFSQLSDNDSLNTAVNNALRRIQQYYPPPLEYKGEKIKVHFYFNNGYYEVN